MIYHEQPTDPWNDFDFALIEAYQTLQDEVCSQCGNPVWLCRSSSNVFDFKVREETCHATRALERHKDNQKKAADRAKGDDKKLWGKFFYTVPELLPNEKAEGAVLPTRKDFLLEKWGLVQ